jgi:hypothetical protein
MQQSHTQNTAMSFGDDSLGQSSGMPDFGMAFESDDEEVKENVPVAKVSLLEKLDADFSALKRTSNGNCDTPSKRIRQQDHSEFICASPLREREPFATLPLAPTPKNRGENKFKRLPKHTNAFEVGMNSDGTPLYFPKKSLKKLSIDATNVSRAGNLLSVPIFKLMQQVREEARLQKSLADNELALAIEEGEHRVATNQPDRDNQLWVHKYRPIMYTDLVGDERIHRNVLNWVKNWDFCVFTREVKRPFQNWKKDFKKEGGFGNFEAVLLSNCSLQTNFSDLRNEFFFLLARRALERQQWRM